MNLRAKLELTKNFTLNWISLTNPSIGQPVFWFVWFFFCFFWEGGGWFLLIQFLFFLVCLLLFFVGVFCLYLDFSHMTIFDLWPTLDQRWIWSILHTVIRNIRFKRYHLGPVPVTPVVSHWQWNYHNLQRLRSVVWYTYQVYNLSCCIQ